MCTTLENVRLRKEELTQRLSDNSTNRVKTSGALDDATGSELTPKLQTKHARNLASANLRCRQGLRPDHGCTWAPGQQHPPQPQQLRCAFSPDRQVSSPARGPTLPTKPGTRRASAIRPPMLSSASLPPPRAGRCAAVSVREVARGWCRPEPVPRRPPAPVHGGQFFFSV